MGIQSTTSHHFKLFLSFKVSDSNKTWPAEAAADKQQPQVEESSTSSIVLGSLLQKIQPGKLDYSKTFTDA